MTVGWAKKRGRSSALCLVVAIQERYLRATDKGIIRCWHEFRDEADFESRRIHNLHHTFASHAALNKETLSIIGRLLGHANLQSTARYPHLDDEHLLDAADQIGAAIERLMAYPIKLYRLRSRTRNCSHLLPCGVSLRSALAHHGSAIKCARCTGTGYQRLQCKGSHRIYASWARPRGSPLRAEMRGSA
ncbi:tyrosine-type recombinase/integrase [Sphingobium sp. Leaf26]|uniref:tyrosine-type recombinase/integrase n=1 Tax=Sphingobium sp. Leaf26 TaxID=1735693 RepID=UPI003FA7C67D